MLARRGKRGMDGGGGGGPDTGGTASFTAGWDSDVIGDGGVKTESGSVGGIILGVAAQTQAGEAVGTSGPADLAGVSPSSSSYSSPIGAASSSPRGASSSRSSLRLRPRAAAATPTVATGTDPGPSPPRQPQPKHSPEHEPEHEPEPTPAQTDSTTNTTVDEDDITDINNSIDIHPCDPTHDVVHLHVTVSDGDSDIDDGLGDPRMSVQDHHDHDINQQQSREQSVDQHGENDTVGGDSRDKDTEDTNNVQTHDTSRVTVLSERQRQSRERRRQFEHGLRTRAQQLRPKYRQEAISKLYNDHACFVDNVLSQRYERDTSTWGKTAEYANDVFGGPIELRGFYTNKKYVSSGLYTQAGTATHRQHRKTRASVYTSFVFPLPMHFGYTLMHTQSDFELPVDLRVYANLYMRGEDALVDAFVAEERDRVCRASAAVAAELTAVATAAASKRRVRYHPIVPRPGRYTYIDRNIFVDMKRVREPEIPCDCVVPVDGSPACGSSCVNRCTFTECGDACPTGDLCTNRTMQSFAMVVGEAAVVSDVSNVAAAAAAEPNIAVVASTASTDVETLSVSNGTPATPVNGDIAGKDTGATTTVEKDILMGATTTTKATTEQATELTTIKPTKNSIRRGNSDSQALELRPTHGRGFGLFTTVDIPAGAFIVEYRGEVITYTRCMNRLTTIYRDATHHYFLDYTDGHVLDAGRKGTCARFINHSCQPNSHIEKWDVFGEVRVGVFALRDIVAGEEITYDYCFVSFGDMQKCLCGADCCGGFIGKQSKRVMGVVDVPAVSGNGGDGDDGDVKQVDGDGDSVTDRSTRHRLRQRRSMPTPTAVVSSRAQPPPPPISSSSSSLSKQPTRKSGRNDDDDRSFSRRRSTNPVSAMRTRQGTRSLSMPVTEPLMVDTVDADVKAVGTRVDGTGDVENRLVNMSTTTKYRLTRSRSMQVTTMEIVSETGDVTRTVDADVVDTVSSIIDPERVASTRWYTDTMSTHRHAQSKPIPSPITTTPATPTSSTSSSLSPVSSVSSVSSVMSTLSTASTVLLPHALTRYGGDTVSVDCVDDDDVMGQRKRVKL